MPVGRYKLGKKLRVKSDPNKQNDLVFLNEKVDGKIPLESMMPMLAGFRADVQCVASAEMDAGERLTDTRWPIAETDITVAPARFAKLNKPSILQRLNEDRQLVTRCSSA